MFEQALAINPEDAGALGSKELHDQQGSDWTNPGGETPRLSGRPSRSIATDPDDPLPYFAKSFYLSLVLHGPERAARSRGKLT